MRKYETVYILRPDLDEAAVEAVNQSVAQAITENGGCLLYTSPSPRDCS